VLPRGPIDRLLERARGAPVVHTGRRKRRWTPLDAVGVLETIHSMVRVASSGGGPIDRRVGVGLQ
jgi:hypothetical protein